MPASAVAADVQPVSTPAPPRRRRRMRDRLAAARISQHVGRRLRERRVALGLSQHRVGQMVGITAQQLAKFERAANRIPTPTLYDIANALRIGVEYFFEGINPAKPQRPASHSTRGAFEIVRAFYLIPEQHRSAVRRLILSLARDERAKARAA